MYDPDVFVMGTSHMNQSVYTLNNAKQLQINHERCQEIERSNKILYDRMINLSAKPTYSTSK
jgi:hypothetical protein